MYTSRYNWKRHETLNESDGLKIKKLPLFFLVETGVNGTTFRGRRPYFLRRQRRKKKKECRL